MKKITAQLITDTVKKLCIDANYYLNDDITKALQNASHNETSPIGKEILQQLIKNAEIAASEKIPLCQDTGLAIVFLEIGQEVHITGSDINQAINDGVKQGYQEGFLRKSVVADPFNRTNTNTNTPAIIYPEIVPGDKLKITVIPKGGGSENMSRLKMLTPTAGTEGIIDFVLETIISAGGQPCPPLIIGIGIGGSFEKCTLLAKRSLLRTIGTRNQDLSYAKLEKQILEKINNLNIGPMGLGGKTTALDVFIEQHPCHLASLPVAVNIQCHAARHKEAVL